MGSSFFRTTSSLMTHSFTFSIEGISYMISSMQLSMIARNPLAPDFRLIASTAMAFRALSVSRRFTPSNSKSFFQSNAMTLGFPFSDIVTINAVVLEKYSLYSNGSIFFLFSDIIILNYNENFNSSFFFGSLIFKIAFSSK